MSEKNELYELLRRIVGIAAAGSSVRILYKRDKNWGIAIANFIGGVILGSLVGYITRNWFDNETWHSMSIAIFAFLGKEITNGIIIKAPVWGQMIMKFIRFMVNDKTDKDVNS